eukprot:CAMPEP_0198540852 /NCGR_PEP_ID=MMETSP1462-20131121/53432_1 /TAXON_ID=1333877 /ORGANISM="Brandtodinium nutriculum, Strain RCC3387" /LENGTH=53 /DNA_ID=CAMNT_0044270987 /DNA_START=114 /DNA_END=272 /DNA_ORIENTATION=-
MAVVLVLKVAVVVGGVTQAAGQVRNLRNGSVQAIASAVGPCVQDQHCQMSGSA